MEFISYEQWLTNNPDLIAEIDCPECHGRGTHACSCGDIHDCRNCNETGRVENPHTRRIYAAECERAAAYTASKSK